jgi:hypothetical protein
MKCSIFRLIQQIDKNGDDIPAVFGNQHLMEIAIANKKRPGFIKVAVSDDMAEMMMRNEGVLLLGTIPKQVFNKAFHGLEKEAEGRVRP